MSSRLSSFALILLGLLALAPQSLLANFPEVFGSSSETSGLANQFSDDYNDASNNYYVPALLAYTKKIGISYSFHYIEPDFRPIRNVTTHNTLINDEIQIANVDTTYDTVFMNSIHAVLPIASKRGAKLAVSVYTPTSGSSLNTGDPLRPEYVMHRSRYQRTMFNANLAYPINNQFAVSVGLYTGTSIESETYFVEKNNGLTGPTNGQVQSTAKPSASLLASIVARFKEGSAYLGFQQSMDSEITARSTGKTSDAGNLFAYDLSMNALAYYDPMIIRIGASRKFFGMKFFGSLEYQYWDDYETPVLRITQNSGLVKGGTNYETINTRNILIPKFAVRFYPFDAANITVGASYRQSPLDESSFSGAGNSVDTDVLMYSLGFGYKFRLFGRQFEWTTAGQWHYLKNKEIFKSANQEDGTSGNKIGSPSYKIGGNIYVFSTGLKLSI